MLGFFLTFSFEKHKNLTIKSRLYFILNIMFPGRFLAFFKKMHLIKKNVYQAQKEPEAA